MTKQIAPVTGWISVRTPPLSSRPGLYQVQYGGAYGTVRFERWDGKLWADAHVSAAFGDLWRGLLSPV